MIVIFHTRYTEFNKNNYIFKNANAPIGDNLFLPYVRLSNLAKDRGINLYTSASKPLLGSDAIVFLDLPDKNDIVFQRALELNIPMYLITLESPIILPGNFIEENHLVFEKVFTWSDRLINKDKDKYIKIHYTYDFPKSIQFDKLQNRKLITLIAGNKISKVSNELYSMRKNFINFMEKKYPLEFDFYGLGWDYYVFDTSLFGRFMNKLKIPRAFFGARYKSYKGSVERKKDVLNKYSFTLCFENVRNATGWISEKLFDAFFSGSVPIYLGTDNITDYVPSSCFIDSRNYDSFDDLVLYLKSMDSDIYDSYTKSILEFIKSSKSVQFTNEYFSDVILSNISNNNDF